MTKAIGNKNKRKADSSASPAVAASARTPNVRKRAKKDEPPAVKESSPNPGPPGNDEGPEEDNLEDEVKDIVSGTPMIKQRTRGYRPDYTKLRVDDEPEGDEKQEEIEDQECKAASKENEDFVEDDVDDEAEDDLDHDVLGEDED